MTAPNIVSALGHSSMAVLRSAPHHHERVQGEVIHDHSCLSLLVAGTQTVWMRREYRLVPGDLLIVPEGMPHYASRIAGAQYVGVALCTHCMRAPWAEILRDGFRDVRRGGLAVRRLGGEAMQSVEQLCERLEVELAGQRSHHELMIDALMSELAVELARAAPAQVRGSAEASVPAAVTEALEFIERHAAESVSLVDVAAAVGRAPAYLTSLLTEHTGRSVVQWVTHGRMALARQLLRSSEEQIAVIAELVGYASPSHFHRTFRREHDVTPAQWRRAHRA